MSDRPRDAPCPCRCAVPPLRACDPLPFLMLSGAAAARWRPFSTTPGRACRRGCGAPAVQRGTSRGRRTPSHRWCGRPEHRRGGGGRQAALGGRRVVAECGGEGAACRWPRPCRAMVGAVCKEVGGRGAATQRIFRLPPSVGDDSSRVGAARDPPTGSGAPAAPPHGVGKPPLPPPGAAWRPSSAAGHSESQTSDLPQGDGVGCRSRPNQTRRAWRGPSIPHKEEFKKMKKGK